MTKKILYQGQLGDPSGYAVAGRGYLKCLSDYIDTLEEQVDLKLLSISADQASSLTEEEAKFLNRFTFSTQEEYDKWVSDGNYHYAFHHPPTYAVKIPSTRPASAKSLTTTCLTVWETDSVPNIWGDILEHLDVDKVIVPCEWNKETFDSFFASREAETPVQVVPHLINETFIENDKIAEVADVIKEDEFTVLTVGQWTDRKALQNVIKSFYMEFKETPEATLIVKTYGNIQDTRAEYQEYQKNEMLREIKKIKNSMLTEDMNTPKCKLHFLYGLFPKEQMNYLYKESNLFALLSRAEGFGLPIAEALANETPVLVHNQGGHVGFTDFESNFIVNCYKTPSYCTVFPLVYTCDSNWFETDYHSAREQFRNAFDAWKDGTLSSRATTAKNCMFEVTADSVKLGKLIYDTIVQEQ
tara:strand:- start:374 stop:1612 length:1239 start_codon:yes stop_codon:yes gene_type:complete